MSYAHYRETLRLLDSAMALLRRTRKGDRQHIQRELRSLSRQLDLLRVRFGQPPAYLQRN
jgi:hypothetical protein